MNDNLRGIAAMSASVVVFIFNDALIKLAAETVPAGQAIGVRGIFATLLLGAALLVTGEWRRIRDALQRQVMVRTVLEVAGSFGYLIALFHIPFAIATAINLSAPLALTALAVIFLKEGVRWRRWTAVIAGFVGVLLVIQPRPGEIDIWAWMVFGTTLLLAVRDLLTRYVPASVPTLVIAFATAVAVAVTGCAWTLVVGWQPMTLHELALVTGAAFLLAMGYHFVVVALRAGEMSVIGSFRYASILWAFGIGWVVWGEIPNLLAVAGIAVIVASGLYTLHRERARRG